MNGYTDMHAHFLYGVDDGARSKDDMEAMLDAAYADGITSIFATPHLAPGVYPMDGALLARRLNEARAYCRERGRSMQIFGGAELMFTPALERFAHEGRLTTMGDSRAVLIEFVPDIAYGEMESAVSMLERAGYDVILAHMERYACLYRRNNAYRLKDGHDLRYQMNCNTVLREHGLLKDRQIKKWLRERVIDLIATDAHDTLCRPTRMRAAHAALAEKYGSSYADKLAGVQPGSLNGSR